MAQFVGVVGYAVTVLGLIPCHAWCVDSVSTLGVDCAAFVHEQLILLNTSIEAILVSRSTARSRRVS